jgi:hypothetical protein
LALPRSSFVKNNTQIEDFGHRIPQDPAGKTREIHRILQEYTGHRWNMEAVFWAGNCLDFFRWIPANSYTFQQEPVGNNRKKTRKIPVRNTAATNSPELPGTGRFRAGLFDLGNAIQ